MPEALIHIGDSKTNTWKDGQVMLVRLGEGTFTPYEHGLGLVVPLFSVTERQAREFEKPVPESAPGAEDGERRLYTVDWRKMLARGDLTVGLKATDTAAAEEEDVLQEGTRIKAARQDRVIFEKPGTMAVLARVPGRMRAGTRRFLGLA